ncbi:TlpA family protein disulfide reductase [Polynucleobacter sp. 30F-ANTBAC]|uniref:TlpA family protein disulfide reductase n=1 Tax=Polynucleobacter sp. 30F-ANTBAC TaxID=2689095 RepID=UPI001C0D827C|nr:TlpA family protein disulfide reductase [Polynucleobacter sp. 30F-ANTBAC]
MNKRQWIFILAIGFLAGALGMGVASYQFRTTLAKDAAIETFLKQELRSPDGEVLPSASWRGKTLVLNFWAPWCPPCVEEMPELVRVQEKYRSKNVLFVGIGVDSPSNLRQFLLKTPVNYPIVLGGLEGSNWAKSMGNPSSGLPFTVLIDEKGSIKKVKLGKISEDELSSWLDAVIITSK